MMHKFTQMLSAYQLHYTWVQTSSRFQSERVPCHTNFGDGYRDELQDRGYNASVVHMDSTHSIVVSARMDSDDYSHASLDDGDNVLRNAL
jgi:hypothetical protein